jgi:nitric oxide reductase large subunit
MYEKIHGPITFAVRLYLAGRIVGLAVMCLLVGLALLYLIGRSSPTRRRHGTYVVVWMIGGWLAAGLASLPFLDGERYWPGEADLGAAGFGMLAGWVVGMIHGALVIWLWPAKEAEPGVGADSR